MANMKTEPKNTVAIGNQGEFRNLTQVHCGNWNQGENGNYRHKNTIWHLESRRMWKIRTRTLWQLEPRRYVTLICEQK
jgi:hypothetical protein